MFHFHLSLLQRHVYFSVLPTKYRIFFLLFQRIESPFLEAVQMTLGDRYTQNVENIYKITIKFIIETLVKGFDNANNTTKPNTT